jgi:hypothetical protein
MSSNPERAKTRASRIALTYYNRPDRFYRARYRFALAAVSLVTLFITVAYLTLKPNDTRSRNFRLSSLASPGPVARPHALWESRCEACHTASESLNPERSAKIFHSETDQNTKCFDCHQFAPHHPNSNLESSPSCATCHQDHQGRDAQLAKVSQNHCTKCHKDLKHSQVQESELSRNSITGFDPEKHPEFRLHLIQQQPTDLKFNHALHLSPGQNISPDGVALIRFKDLPEKDRTRYGLKGPEDLESVVSLQCDSCHHRSETDQYAESNVTARQALLKNPLPVQFNRDCAACHPQSFSETQSKVLQVSHGLQLNELMEELRMAFFKQALENDPSMLNKKSSETILPGKTIKITDDTIRKLIDEKVENAGELLLGKSWRTNGPSGKRGCVECHEFTESDSEIKYQIKPVNATRSKLTAARFDHSRHQLMDCQSCHNAERSKNSVDNLIPKIQNCFACHGETSLSRNASANAGSSCTTCHGYHGSEIKPEDHLRKIRKTESPKLFQQILDP